MSIEDDIRAANDPGRRWLEAASAIRQLGASTAAASRSLRGLAPNMLADDVAGLKAQAKRGSRSALLALAERGIYPPRLWRAHRHG